MKKVFIFLAVVLLAVFIYNNMTTAETKESDTSGETTVVPEHDKPAQPDSVEELIEWVKEKVESGELEAWEEEKARRAIESDDMEHLLKQAQELYEKYGIEVVEEANEAINEAVGDALTMAAKGFFINIKDSVSEFIKEIFSS